MLTFRHFPALRALDLIDRRFDDVYGDWAALGFPQRAWPVISGFETKEAFVYKADVPGLAEADLSVGVEDGTLVLKGERKIVDPDGAAGARPRAAGALVHPQGRPARPRRGVGRHRDAEGRRADRHAAQGEGHAPASDPDQGRLTDADFTALTLLMARIDTEAADDSVQPFQVRPSGLRAQASPSALASPSASPASASGPAATPSFVARHGRSVPSDARRRRSHESQKVSVVPVMKPARG